jgi:hypothetical protein
LKNIQAPHFEVYTVIDLRTMTASANFTIDRALNLPGPNIIAGLLSDAKVLCPDDRTGAQFNYTVHLTLSARNSLPADGIIEFLLSSRVLLGDVVTVSPQDPSVMDGTWIVQSNGSSIRVNRTGDGSVILPNTQIVLILSGIRNPLTTGSTGKFGLTTRTSAGASIDQLFSIPERTTFVGNLTHASFTPASFVSFALLRTSSVLGLVTWGYLRMQF